MALFFLLFIQLASALNGMDQKSFSDGKKDLFINSLIAKSSIQGNKQLKKQIKERLRFITPSIEKKWTATDWGILLFNFVETDFKDQCFTPYKISLNEWMPFCVEAGSLQEHHSYCYHFPIGVGSVVRNPHLLNALIYQGGASIDLEGELTDIKTNDSKKISLFNCILNIEMQGCLILNDAS